MSGGSSRKLSGVEAVGHTNRKGARGAARADVDRGVADHDRRLRRRRRPPPRSGAQARRDPACARRRRRRRRSGRSDRRRRARPGWRRLMSPGLLVSTARRRSRELVERLPHARVEPGGVEETAPVFVEEHRKDLVRRTASGRPRPALRATRTRAPLPMNERTTSCGRDGASGRGAPQRAIDGGGEVLAGVDERPVEVEDDETRARARPVTPAGRGAGAGATAPCSLRWPARDSRSSPSRRCRSSRRAATLRPRKRGRNSSSLRRADPSIALRVLRRRRR